MMNIFESLIEISQELGEATRTAFKGGDKATADFQRKLKEMGMAQEYMKMVRLLKKKGSGFGLFMKEEDRGEEYSSRTGIGPSLGFSIEKVNGEKLGSEDVQKRGDTTYKKTLVAMNESVELDESVGDIEITYPSSGPAEVFASSMTRKGVKGIVVKGKKVIFNIRDFNKATNIKQPLSHFLDSAKSNGATVKGIGFTLDEVSPPGWEGTVKAMKKKKGDEKIDNPWALAWWMKGKGYKSHYNKDGTKKESVQEEDKWIQKAIKKPGSLRAYFGKEEGEEITKKELDDLIRRLSKEAEGEKKLSASDRKLLQKANLAKTLRGFKK